MFNVSKPVKEEVCRNLNNGGAVVFWTPHEVFKGLKMGAVIGVDRVKLEVVPQQHQCSCLSLMSPCRWIY